MKNNMENIMNSNMKKNSQETFTIKEISKSYDLPASTLRYYEDLGILSDVERNESGQRVYTEEHKKRLDGIMCFKGTGMPVAKIKKYYDLESNIGDNIDEIIDLVSEQEQDVIHKMKALQEAYDHIHYKVRYYKVVKEELKKGNPIPDYWSLDKEE